MTRLDRILSVIRGLVQIIFAIVILIDPEDGLLIVIAIIGIGVVLRGLGSLLYYFTMSRCMVGGRFALYRGLVFLDFGVFTLMTVKSMTFYLIAYIAGMSIITALISLLRALEAKRTGSPQWRFMTAFGVTNVIMALIVVIGGILLKKPSMAIDVYACTLIYSSILRIMNATRRSAIIYIQ